MELSFLRDLVIVIFGILGIVATLMSIVFLSLFYRKATMVYRNIIEPIAQIQDSIAGIRSIIDAVSFITKKRGKKNEQQ